MIGLVTCSESATLMAPRSKEAHYYYINRIGGCQHRQLHTHSLINPRFYDSNARIRKSKYSQNPVGHDYRAGLLSLNTNMIARGPKSSSNSGSGIDR